MTDQSLKTFSKKYTHTVLQQEQGISLSKWVFSHHPYISFALFNKWLRTKDIKVNHKKTHKNYILKENDHLTIPPYSLDQVKEEKNTFYLSQKDIDSFKSWIIYQNDDYFILNKPSKIAVQGGSKITHHIDGYLSYFKDPVLGPPKLVHRLDKDTSGLLLIARTPQAASYYSHLFKTQKIQKTYYALTFNTPSVKKGRIEKALIKTNISGEEKVVIDQENGKPAITLYEVIQEKPPFSLLKLTPLTGRTHQLRVHCQSINCSIVGDKKYKNASSASSINPKYLHLHASGLSFIDQQAQEQFFTCPLPAYFHDILDI